MTRILSQSEVNSEHTRYNKWLNSFRKPETVEKTAFGIWLASASDSKKQQIEILGYCRPHTDQMWAANIVSIILSCDFRDAKQKVEEYFNEVH